MDKKPIVNSKTNYLYLLVATIAAIG